MKIAQALQKEYQKRIGDDWVNSPFGWIKQTLPSRTIGKIGEELVERFCNKYGIKVNRPGSHDADLVIGQSRVEVKFSTLWGAGFYKFQQIRDQGYDYIVALGVSPDSAHCWVIPKMEAMRNAEVQHAGRRGSDTQWITIDPSSPPEWIKAFGGDLRQVNVVELLRRLSQAQ